MLFVLCFYSKSNLIIDDVGHHFGLQQKCILHFAKDCQGSVSADKCYISSFTYFNQPDLPFHL